MSKISEYEYYEDLIQKAQGQAESDWECNFVDDMWEKLQKYEDNVIFSEKQIDKLHEIAEKQNLAKWR